jgi:hypothetical protein
LLSVCGGAARGGDIVVAGSMTQTSSTRLHALHFTPEHLTGSTMLARGRPAAISDLSVIPSLK